MGSKHFKKTGDFILLKADAAIRCPSCKHVRHMSALAFAQMFPRNPPIASAARRLRCGECGYKGAGIAAVPRREG